MRPIINFQSIGTIIIYLLRTIEEGQSEKQITILDGPIESVLLFFLKCIPRILHNVMQYSRIGNSGYLYLQIRFKSFYPLNINFH